MLKTPLYTLSAVEMVNAIRARRISAVELMESHLRRIEEANPQINAIVNLDAEGALAAARRADQATMAGKTGRALHGLPVAIKDSHDAYGWPTTHGSRLMAENYPVRDELEVQRIRAAGALIIGKTNVPEFSAGASTMNDLFGITRNPYNLGHTSGGSSGGAAAAVSAGLVPLADGSDFGGSLRVPAAFCNVVGLRPSPGVVPTWPKRNPWNPLVVQGPIARDVGDVKLMMSAIAGYSSLSPLSVAGLTTRFREDIPLPELGHLSVAVTADLGGTVRIESNIREAMGRLRPTIEEAGARVVDKWPDLSGAHEAFLTLRAWMLYDAYRDLLASNRTTLNNALASNIAAGSEISGQDVANAFSTMGQIRDRVVAFFRDYDVLVLPATQVSPFSADLRSPEAVDGDRVDSYIDWVKATYLISVTGCPSIVIPASFAGDGVPVGVQLVGPPGEDDRLLGIAGAIERLLWPEGRTWPGLR